MSDASSSAAPLTQHLDALYPLARVLAGEADAEALVTDAYRRAAEAPAGADDPRTRLVQHLLAAHADRAGTLAHAPPEALSVRRDAAVSVAERNVPAAFALCSPHTRLVLALDAALGLPDARLAEALDVAADDAAADRAAAWAALRRSLHAVVTESEGALIDANLPGDALREILRTHLTAAYRPAPSDLRSAVASVLRQAEEESAADASPDGASADTGSASPSEDDPPADASEREGSSQRPGRAQPSASRSSARRTVATTVGALVLAALAGAVLWQSLAPAPSPDVSLVTFSARRAGAVSVPVSMDTPEAAERYLSREWDRRVTVPEIRNATLQGVSALEVDDNLRIPALLYADSAATGRITVFAYSYALIDRLGDRAPLDDDLFERLRTPEQLIARAEADAGVVLWRQRADVFLAVAPHLSPDALRTRLRLR